jgi:hypothetical protein
MGMTVIFWNSLVPNQTPRILSSVLSGTNASRRYFKRAIFLPSMQWEAKSSINLTCPILWQSVSAIDHSITCIVCLFIYYSYCLKAFIATQKVQDCRFCHECHYIFDWKTIQYEPEILDDVKSSRAVIMKINIWKLQARWLLSQWFTKY